MHHASCISTLIVVIEKWTTAKKKNGKDRNCDSHTHSLMLHITVLDDVICVYIQFTSGCILHIKFDWYGRGAETKISNERVQPYLEWNQSKGIQQFNIQHIYMPCLAWPGVFFFISFSHTHLKWNKKNIYWNFEPHIHFIRSETQLNWTRRAAR